MVSLHNAEQDRYIATLAGSGKNTYTWTGLNDRITEGTYMWSDGSSVEYTNWQPGEPSGQDCVAYKSSAFGSLADRTCTERHRYVCQQPLEGEGSAPETRFFCPSVSLYDFQSIRPSNSVSVSPLVCRLYVCVSVSLSVCPPVSRPSVSFCLSAVFPFVCRPSVRLSTCLFVRRLSSVPPSVCMPLCPP